MHAHEIRSFYLRLVLGVLMALFGIAAVFTTPRPESFTQHDANKTVLLQLDNVSGAALAGDTNSTSSIAYLRYVPVNLRDTGAAAVFVATLLAIAGGGGYTGSIILRVEEEIRNTSTDTADYNARMSKCDRRDLELLAGPFDRCLCVLYMMVACIALAIAATLSLLDEWKSPRISIARETAIDFMVRVRGAGAIDTGTVVFGAEDTDAAYTFKAWVCGWENSSLLVGNKPGYADFHTACQRQKASEYLLLVVFGLACVQMIIATQPYLISRVIDFIAVVRRSGITRANSKRWKVLGGDWIALSSIEDKQSFISEEA